MTQDSQISQTKPKGHDWWRPLQTVRAMHDNRRERERSQSIYLTKLIPSDWDFSERKSRDKSEKLGLEAPRESLYLRNCRDNEKQRQINRCVRKSLFTEKESHSGLQNRKGNQLLLLCNGGDVVMATEVHAASATAMSIAFDWKDMHALHPKFSYF